MLPNDIQSSVQSREIGIARRGGNPVASVHAPNLTDTSFPGLYAATTQLPSKIGRTANQISARIGAPALSGGDPPSVIASVEGGGGNPVFGMRRFIPVEIEKAAARVRVFIMGNLPDFLKR